MLISDSLDTQTPTFTAEMKFVIFHAGTVYFCGLITFVDHRDAIHYTQNHLRIMFVATISFRDLKTPCWPLRYRSL